MSKTFYWIALETPAGGIDVRGPYNTMQGRDKEYIQNSDFWASAGVPAIPFETIGRKKADAYSLAKQVLEQNAAPQSPATPSTPQVVTQYTAPQPTYNESTIYNEPMTNTPPVETAIKQEIGGAHGTDELDKMRPFNDESLESIADNYRRETVGEDISGEDLDFEEAPGDTILGDNIDAAINAEVADADRYEEQIFSGV